ncbi:hypothetical protein SUGI_0408010 [Cryptomeria japonica]|nr:hypothetical protein SUGI_0408010 [Cryptomeria japonica]
MKISWNSYSLLRCIRLLSYFALLLLFLFLVAKFEENVWENSCFAVISRVFWKSNWRIYLRFASINKPIHYLL